MHKHIKGQRSQNLVKKSYNDSRLAISREKLVQDKSAAPSSLRYHYSSVTRQVQSESFKAFLDQLIFKNNRPYSFWKALNLLDNKYYIKVRDPSLGKEEDIKNLWIKNVSISEELLMSGETSVKPDYWEPSGLRSTGNSRPSFGAMKRILKKKPSPGCSRPDGISYKHLKVLGVSGYEIMSELLCEIIASEEWPLAYKQGYS